MKKSKGIAVALVVCFVAVIAVVGMTTFNRYEKRLAAEQAKAGEETKEKDEPLELPKENIQLTDESQMTNTEQIQAEIKEPEEVQVNASENIVVEQPVEPKLSFSKEDTLIWPVDGNVVLNYSMDQTIYFATLDQYKYNPALIISGEEGNPVKAAAEGKVISIGTDAQTGNTVTVDIGNGYEIVYGQLEEIRVIEGESIEQGTVIGYLSAPTKYYSVEGCNLYFKLSKDGEPENPLDYMEE